MQGKVVELIPERLLANGNLLMAFYNNPFKRYERHPKRGAKLYFKKLESYYRYLLKYNFFEEERNKEIWSNVVFYPFNYAHRRLVNFHNSSEEIPFEILKLIYLYARHYYDNIESLRKMISPIVHYWSKDIKDFYNLINSKKEHYEKGILKIGRTVSTIQQKYLNQQYNLEKLKKSLSELRSGLYESPDGTILFIKEDVFSKEKTKEVLEQLRELHRDIKATKHRIDALFQAGPSVEDYANKSLFFHVAEIIKKLKNETSSVYRKDNFTALNSRDHEEVA